METMTKLDDFDPGDPCPVHDTDHRKIYVFGSTMTGETEVCTFRGCRCAVSVTHDPVGTYHSAAMYHTRFSEAEGRGCLHRDLCAVKYR